jgi:glycerol-3-phosphate dehydrogenase (NAD(P)+)
MATIAIVGAGMMGTALAWPLCDNGHTVRLVGTPLDGAIVESLREARTHPRLSRRIPDGVQVFSHAEIPEAIEGVDLIASGVSSFGVAWFADTVGPHLCHEIPVIAVTKGLEDNPNGDLAILPDVTDARLPAHLQGRVRLCAIGGPCIAHELAARRQTCVVFSGREVETLEALKTIFATDYYHIWLSTDLIGVEVCAALKNGYAMGVGLAVGMMEAAGPDGLANMYNPQAGLFAQGCREMRLLLQVLGGSVENVAWLPGAGDLYVTVFGGRTVRLGKLLGSGLSFAEARERLAGETLESVEIISRVARALPKLEKRGLVRMEDFPLLLHLDAILNRGETVRIPWETFFNGVNGSNGLSGAA